MISTQLKWRGKKPAYTSFGLRGKSKKNMHGKVKRRGLGRRRVNKRSSCFLHHQLESSVPPVLSFPLCHLNPTWRIWAGGQTPTTLPPRKGNSGPMANTTFESPTSPQIVTYITPAHRCVYYNPPISDIAMITMERIAWLKPDAQRVPLFWSTFKIARAGGMTRL